MQSAIYSRIWSAYQDKRKQLAVLIDPDKSSHLHISEIINQVNINQVDYVFVGGSLLTGSFHGECVEMLKGGVKAPVVLFPGNAMQINGAADGILLLSLISGRNPELLIGSHVVAAPLLKRSGLEIIPTGYMLIESGRLTSVVYMSNTTPIPSDKTDIALCTAMAGEMLGMKLIYMDAGSGASRPVSENIIRNVRSNIDIPIIVGGGIQCSSSAQRAWDAGADIVVVGSAVEKNPGMLDELSGIRDISNRISA